MRWYIRCRVQLSLQMPCGLLQFRVHHLVQNVTAPSCQFWRCIDSSEMPSHCNLHYRQAVCLLKLHGRNAILRCRSILCTNIRCGSNVICSQSILPRHEHYSVHLGDLKQLQPYLLRISQNLSFRFQVLGVDMQVHLVEEAKRLLAVDPPSASLDSSRTAVPASPSLLGWPPLAAAAADDALPPAHQDIFQHDTPGALQCALQSLTVLSE